ncbi:MAG TPA: thioredoxin family protein [Bryobacteraceae bacterium]|jgi:thiol-disulfide isomerase/thioredoxin|nr:thioredoxin family protein [Bryobacteraceae bacterium]
MAATESTMLDLGTAAPGFSLPDVVSGKTVSLGDFAGKHALLVMFICPHCPYVKHVQSKLAEVLKEYAGTPLGIVAIGSNDAVQFPDDGPAGLRSQAAELGFDFPYLYDESQAVAQAYRAACTPDFFLFDAGLKLVYRGQMDGARPKNDTPVTGSDLRAAIDATLAGRPVDPVQRPSLGCNIKWKKGNEPAY